MTEKPLFRTVDAALKWAFKERHGLPSQFSHTIAKFMEKSRLPEENPGDRPRRAIDPGLGRIDMGLDEAAQTGMLQSFVFRQPQPRNLHLLSKYAHGELKREARRQLRDFLMPLLNCTLRPRWAVYKIVCRWYDGKKSVTYKDIAKRIEHLIERREGETDEKRTRRVWRQAREIAHDVDPWMKQLGTQAEEAAHAQLRKMGVIG